MLLRQLILFLASALAAVTSSAAYGSDRAAERTSNLAVQLERFGLSLSQTQCVARQLTQALTPRQIRNMLRALRGVSRGFYNPDRLTVRDLLHVARGMEDNAIGVATTGATLSCNATPEAIAARDVERFMATVPPPRPRQPAWLSLGAAPTGQSIAIDGATLVQQGTTRTAWFRLIDPPPAPVSPNIYSLRIDCAARTISSLARRRQETDGRVSEFRETPDIALPIEGGTVMEIAFLSLCAGAP